MSRLIDAVFRNDEAEVQFLLKERERLEEVDGDKRTALIHAVIDNKIKMVECLIDAGANINVRDVLGCVPLYYAADRYYVEIASLLISKGVIVDSEDVYGNTPLCKAVFNSRGRGEMIRLLLAAGADMNYRNKNNKTPLDLAKLISNYPVLQFMKI